MFIFVSKQLEEQFGVQGQKLDMQDEKLLLYIMDLETSRFTKCCQDIQEIGHRD
jgi:hypothetical protein